MFPDIIGWTGSAVLLCTLLRQTWTQVHSESAQGVSRWLFAGQIAASLLFLSYSIAVGDAVFIASNAAILLAAVGGQVAFARKRRAARA